MELEDDSNLSAKALYDYKVVKKALSGDQKAYAELMGRYRDSVYFMLLKMVSNKDDADDLTIEAFGKAFSRLKQYTPNYAFSTWLFKIASNNCIDFIRRRKLKMTSIDVPFDGEDGESPGYEIKSSDRNPEQEAIRDQKIVLLREVVDKLKPRYKELVEMRYFQEMSYEEISEKLDLPLGTVKAQLFRARDFLYDILKNSEHKI
ncbi:MAG: RNA polymerase sigma factor [Bacteroidia bacterium]